MPSEAPPAVARWSRLAAVATLAAFVFAARVWLIRAGGSVVPTWDQWDAEAALLYPRWLDGTLSFSDLFSGHNEHRIALTRLADLALFAAGGGWNPWAQLLLNAALHAAAAAGLAAWFWPTLEGRARAGFIAALAVLFSCPAGWQNALWGFQSQVYFGNLLAVAALGALTLAAPLGRTWWLGWIATLLALFANAGGTLMAGAALAVGLVTLRAAPSRRATLVALAALAALIAIGFALKVEVPQHAGLRARSVGEWLAVFSRCLAWPHVNTGWLAVIVQAPLVVLLLWQWLRGTALDGPTRLALALALLSVLHAAAIAHSRGAGLPDHRPLSRYQDPLLLGAAAQAFAACALARLGSPPLRWLAFGWFAVVAAGLITLTETNLTLNLPYKRAQDAASHRLILEYRATGRADVFSRDADFRGPHPESATVMRVLDDPRLRRTLPPALLLPADDPQQRPPAVVRHAPVLAAVAALALAAALIGATRVRRATASPG